MAALPNPVPGPRPVPAHDRPKPAKPDARPMRAALGLGGIAAMSAIAAGIVSPPRPEAIVLAAPTLVAPGATDQQAAIPTADPAAAVAGGDPTASATRQIIYVQLQPGQTAPPGATVISASAGPSVAIQLNGGGAKPASGGGQVAATAKPAPPAPPKSAPTPIIIKTTQSGKVVP